MDLAALNSATLPITNTDSSTKSQKDLDNFIGTREDFLTILLAQLKHQDPLNPMEGTEFIDSITRLSSVEQDVNQNLNLEKIVSLLEGKQSSFGDPVSYLNKNVEFESDVIELKKGSTSFSYNLNESVGQSQITIQDENGEIVFSGKGTANEGRNNIKWDGTDSVGNPLKDGLYVVTVSVPEKPGSTKLTNVPITTSGVVTGANFADENVVLTVGQLVTSLDAIKAVNVE